VAGGTEDFIVELLTEFLEADHNHRSFIRSLLIEQGLQVLDISFYVKERERDSVLIRFFPYFTSEMTGLLVALLSTTPPYFTTRLY